MLALRHRGVDVVEAGDETLVPEALAAPEGDIWVEPESLDFSSDDLNRVVPQGNVAFPS